MKQHYLSISSILLINAFMDRKQIVAEKWLEFGEQGTEKLVNR